MTAYQHQLLTQHRIKLKHCLMLLLLCLSFDSSADVPPTIKVVTEQLTPYQIKDADGAITGYSTEVIQALFDTTKLPYEIKMMSWARAYEIAQKEKNVLVYSIARTPHRESMFHWIGNLTPEHLYFWGMKEKFSQPVNGIEQLKQYKIAVSRHSNAEQYLIEHNFYNIFQLIKEEQNILMLHRGRVDLIVATEYTIAYRAKRLGLDFNQMIPVADARELSNNLSIAMNLGSDAALVQQLQTAYQQLVQQGKIEQLQEKWQVQ
jgi:polar amino acid transport system substrate-binding protein